MSALSERLRGGELDPHPDEPSLAAAVEGDPVEVAAISDADDSFVTPMRLSVRTVSGWFALGTIGAFAEDRTFSSYAQVLGASSATTSIDGESVPVVLVSLEQGTSTTRGCSAPEERAERTSWLCVLAPEPDCFLAFRGSVVPYGADNRLPSPAEALGECDDAALDEEPAPTGPSAAAEQGDLGLEVALLGDDRLEITRDGAPTTLHSIAVLHRRARPRR